MEQIACAEQPDYGDERAVSRHNSDYAAAPGKHQCAVCDGVFHDRVLCELPEARSEARPDESDELLQSAGGAG